jgi:glucan-binding YG repeat protein
MSNLTKEEVIAKLQLALEKQSSEKIEIVQKGSWYKINEGKSLRFSDLEQMLADFNSGTAVTPPAMKAPEKKTAAAKPATSKPAKKAAPKATASKTIANTNAAVNNAGLTPKQVWREKLANAGGQTLPRGF